MKKILMLLWLGAVITGCDSGGGASAPQALTETSPVGVAPITSPTVLPSVIPTPSPSVSPSPSPSPSPSYTFSGSGTVVDPYVVVTPSDVQHIQDFPAAHFHVNGTIDMTGVSFTPIQNFSGVIQGGQLNNLVIATTGANPAALVINLTGIINGLYLFNATVSSQAGYATLYAYTLTGTVQNCQAWATITSPLGGNGQTGVGNPIYVSFLTGAVTSLDQATVTFNGHSFLGTY